MKKLFLLSVAAILSFGSFAQGNSGKNGKHHKYEKHHDNDRDDGYDRDERNHRNSRNDGYSRAHNLPQKVQQAFARDYPGARNVSWTKSRGVWTATYRRNGLFGGTRSISYYANGRQADGIYAYDGNRDNRW